MVRLKPVASCFLKNQHNNGRVGVGIWYDFDRAKRRAGEHSIADAKFGGKKGIQHTELGSPREGCDNVY